MKNIMESLYIEMAIYAFKYTPPPPPLVPLTTLKFYDIYIYYHLDFFSKL